MAQWTWRRSVDHYSAGRDACPTQKMAWRPVGRLAQAGQDAPLLLGVVGDGVQEQAQACRHPAELLPVTAHQCREVAQPLAEKRPCPGICLQGVENGRITYPQDDGRLELPFQAAL